MNLETMGKLLIVAALLLAFVGGLFYLLGRIGLEQLPGDLSIKRPGFSCFLPIVTSILISIILTLMLNLYFYLRR